MELVIVFDGSRSTVDPTGSDIDRDGVIGRPHLGDWGLAADFGSTDPGDTLLSAQVLAARSLVHALASSDVRFAIAIFYGSGSAWEGPHPVGEIVAALTNDRETLDTALEEILRRQPMGMTSFATGMGAAIDVLSGDSGRQAVPRRVAFLVSDSPAPNSKRAGPPLKGSFSTHSGWERRLPPHHRFRSVASRARLAGPIAKSPIPGISTATS